MKQQKLIKTLTVSTLALSLLVPTAGAVQVHAATTKYAVAASSTSERDALINKIDYDFVQDVMENINDKKFAKDRKEISDTLGLYKSYKDTTDQKFGLSRAVRAIYAQNQQKTKDELIQKINSNYKGSSIVDYLKSAKQPSSFKNRKALAEKLLMLDYSGTAKQNAEMLKILRSNGK
ncbi:hypothetical protein [Priestia megaterium]|uniref:hypothetical protein n=1 Tax=Priestia megaterium TaxID=1404 RepID=UPI0031012A82